MANKTLAQVAIELDSAYTGKSFSQLYGIVNDVVNKIPKVTIQLDESATAKSFSGLKKIVDSEIERIQSSFDALGNIAINGSGFGDSLNGISKNVESIRAQIEKLTDTLNNASVAGSASFDGLINKIEELRAVLNQINGKEFGNVTQILSNGLSPEVAKNNALKQYREDAIALELELTNMWTKLGNVMGGLAKGSKEHSLVNKAITDMLGFDPQNFEKSIRMSGVDKIGQKIASDLLSRVNSMNAAIESIGETTASKFGLHKLEIPEYNLESVESATKEASDGAKDLYTILENITLKLDEINTSIKSIFSFDGASPDYSNIESIVTKIKSYFDDMVAQINSSLGAIGSGITSNVSSSLNKETENLGSAGGEAAEGINKEQKALENVESIKESVAKKEKEVALGTEAVGIAADTAADDLREENEELDFGNDLYAKRTTYFDKNNNPVSRTTLYMDSAGVTHNTYERYNSGSWELEDFNTTDSRIKRYNEVTKQLEHAYAQREKIQRKIYQLRSDIDINGDTNVVNGVGDKGKIIDRLNTGSNGLNDINATINALEREAAAYSDLEAGSGRMAAQQQKMNELIRDSAVKQSEYNAKVEKSILRTGSADYSKFYKQINDELLKVTEAQKNWTKAKSGDTAGEYNKLEGYRKALNDLANDLNGPNGLSKNEADKRLSAIRKEFSETSKVIKESGKDSKSFIDVLKGVKGAFGGLVTSARLAQAAFRIFKEAVNEAIDLQDTLVDLQIVTGAKGDEFDSYARGVSSTAKEIGVATKDLVTATTTFARLGYSLPDSNVLAKYVAMLEKVGGIDPQSAQDSLTAMLAAFPDDVNIQNIEQAMDKLVVVGNNFPISVSQIAEGMNNASSSLSAAGNSFEESVALLMGANVTIQNASKASTALRTISARIFKTTSELDELGESMEESKYNDVISGLTKRGVKIIDDATGEYRKLYDILKDVSSVWAEMTSLEQSALLDTFGATRGRDVLISLINNFDKVEEAMSEMGESGNALEEAYSKTFNSLETSVKQFKAAVGGLGYEIIDQLTPAIKLFIDAGAKIISFIDNIINLTRAFGGLEIVIPTLTTISLLIKGLTAAAPAHLANFSSLFGLVLNPLQKVLFVLNAIAIAVGVLDKVIVTYDEQVAKVKELKSEYNSLFGLGSEYDDLLARSSQLTEQERERLEILEKEEKIQSEKIKKAERKEFDKWGEEVNRNFLTKNGALSESRLDKYKREFDTLNAEYESGKISLDDYKESLSNLASASLEFYKQYADYKELGFDVSAFNPIAKWYEALTDTFMEAGYINTPEYFKEQFKEAWSSASAETDFWISTIKKNLEKFVDDEGIINADVIKKTGEEVAKRGDTYEYWNKQEAAYIRLNTAAKQYGLTVEDLIPILVDFGVIAESSTGSIENSSKNIKEAVDLLKEEKDALNAAISEQTESGSVSLDTYNELIKKSSDYSYCLEIEGNSIRINTEEAQRLYDQNKQIAKSQAEYNKALLKAKYAENAREIKNLRHLEEDLTNAQEDQLKSLLNEQSSIADNIIQYQLLITELNNAERAYNKFKDAMNAANSGDNYEDFRGLQEQFQDWIDAGQTGVGNLQFKAYLDFVMPEGAEYDIKKYKEQVIDKLFTEDNEGSRKFMQALIEQGFAEGTIEEAVFKSGVAWQDLVDKITIDGQHISEGVAELMFDQLSMYEKFNFDWREFYGIEEAQDASVIQIANIEEAQAKLSALREEYKKLKADPETAEEAANIQAKMKEYQDYIETVMPTVNIEQELTTVDEKLGSIIDQLSGEKPTIGDLGAPDAISKLGELESLITKIKGDLEGGWLESANSLIATFNTAKEAAEESVDVTRGMPGMYGRTYGSISNKASIRGEGIGGSPVGDPESLAGRFSDAAEDINVDVNSIISDIEELKDELLSLGEEYNSLINGNLDYNKRPILSAKDLIDAGWDVAKEDMESIFTTYSSGFDHVGNFSISITPILEDGSVLSPQALEDYVSNLVGDSGLEQLLESDKYHLIIGVDENPEWNDEYWASFENSINSVKQEHAALVNDILLEQGIINQGGEFTITTNADETVKKLDEVASYKIKDKSFTIKAFVQSIGETVNTLTNKVKNEFGSHAAGTPNAKGGKTLVNELGPELISENGRAYIANGGNPAVIDLSPGAIVLDADTTKKALAYQTIGKKIGAYASGTNSKKCLNCGKAIAINTVTCPYCGAPQNTTAYLAWKKAQTPVKTTSSSKDYVGGVPTGGGSSSSSGGGSGGGGGSSGSSSKDKEESWFEKQYKEHQHLLEMDQESVANYLVWLNDAYQRAYKEGIIELDDFYKYAEEIYKGLHDHFIDYLNDNEFTIEMLNNQEDTSGKVADIYRQLLNDVRVQIDNAYAQGLRDTDDYVQELWQKWWSYHDDLEDLRETTESDAKDAVDSLVQYRIKMIEKELEDEKKSYDDRLNNLKEFIDKQKQMLRNSADEEDYLKEQADKRKKISDLEARLAQLEFDDSAWAQKKKLELQEELTTAKEDLQTFERDHAIEMTETELDSVYELAEEASNRQTDLLQRQLDNASVLYQKALDDVRNNSQELYDEMVAYELSQGSGVADAIKEMWEEAYIALDKYKGLYGEFYRGVELQNLTGYTQEVINTSLPSGARSGYVSPLQGTYTPSTSVSTSSTPAAAPPSLAVGSYVDVKSGAKWYGNSYGGDGSGSARGGTIKYTNPGSPYPYNIDGAGWVRKEDIVGYAHGTSNATKGLHAFDEDGSEYIFTSSDGNKYKLFNSGDKVLNSKASQFLYDFANKGSSIIGNFTKGLNNFFGNIGSMSPIQVNMGDIIVSGNANELTVSEIRRAQRENVDYMLKEFRRLKA